MLYVPLGCNRPGRRECGYYEIPAVRDAAAAEDDAERDQQYDSRRASVSLSLYPFSERGGAKNLLLCMPLTGG